MDLLLWGVLLVIGVKVISLGANLVQKFTTTNFSQSVMMNIQKALMEHVLRLPKAFFDQKEVGYLISRIGSDVQGLNWFFSGTVIYMLTNIFKFLGGLGFLFYLEWRLALGCLLVLPALLFSVRFFSSRIRNLSHHSMEARASIYTGLQETIASIPLIKAFSSEISVKHSVSSMRWKKAGRSPCSKMWLDRLPAWRSTAHRTWLKELSLSLGLTWPFRGIGRLVPCWHFNPIWVMCSALPCSLADANLSVQRSLASLERVMNLLNTVKEENLETGIKVEHIQGEITFDNVSFSYGGEEKVLEDITFHIKPGEHIALVRSFRCWENHFGEFAAVLLPAKPG